MRIGHGYDVHRLVSGLTEQYHRPFQQDEAGDALQGRVGVWERLADVPQAGGAQQGVHDGVGEHVGVRMPQQSLFPGNVYAA